MKTSDNRSAGDNERAACCAVAISRRKLSGGAGEGRLRADSHELITRALQSSLSPAVPAAPLSAGAVSAAAAPAALLLAAASAAPAPAAAAALLALPDAQAARALQAHLDKGNRISRQQRRARGKTNQGKQRDEKQMANTKGLGSPAPLLLVPGCSGDGRGHQPHRSDARCVSAAVHVPPPARALLLLLMPRLTFPTVLASMVGTSRSPMWADHSLAVATRVSLSHPHVRRLPLLGTEWGGKRERQEQKARKKRKKNEKCQTRMNGPRRLAGLSLPLVPPAPP